MSVIVQPAAKIEVKIDPSEIKVISEPSILEKRGIGFGIAGFFVSVLGTAAAIFLAVKANDLSSSSIKLSKELADRDQKIIGMDSVIIELKDQSHKQDSLIEELTTLNGRMFDLLENSREQLTLAKNQNEFAQYSTKPSVYFTDRKIISTPTDDNSNSYVVYFKNGGRRDALDLKVTLYFFARPIYSKEPLKFLFKDSIPQRYNLLPDQNDEGAVRVDAGSEYIDILPHTNVLVEFSYRDGVTKRDTTVVFTHRNYWGVYNKRQMHLGYPLYQDDIIMRSTYENIKLKDNQLKPNK